MFGAGTKLLQQAERINRKFEQDIIKEVWHDYNFIWINFDLLNLLNAERHERHEPRIENVVRSFKN